MKFKTVMALSVLISLKAYSFDFMSEVARQAGGGSTNTPTAATVDVQGKPEENKYTVQPPMQWNVSFSEADFDSKSWLKDFPYVVVVNKATSGLDKQSIRVYKHGRLVMMDEIVTYLKNYQKEQTVLLDMQNQLFETMKINNDQIQDKNEIEDMSKALEFMKSQNDERPDRIRDLKNRIWRDGVYKVSTGRDAFEKKGTHNSQKDSWTITPSGFFTPQFFDLKHKSESYSKSICDNFFGKMFGVDCVYMENAIFFNGAIALHTAIPGTEAVLGNKASGGCVRLPGALAEYLYLNILNETGTPYPLVNNDGTVKTDAAGKVLYSDRTKSIWGEMENHGALIIVQEKVVNK